MSPSAVQKYLAAEPEISETCILVGSWLPRGVWEAWIDKVMHLGSVLDLTRGGRGTRRPDTEPPICCKNRSKDQDQQQIRTAFAEETLQAPFSESEWELKSLLHWVEQPNLSHRIKTLLVKTLLGGLPKPLNTNGRTKSHHWTSGRKINSSHKHSS
jgi:hypothetical protein